jgi:hypothetical protein
VRIHLGQQRGLSNAARIGGIDKKELCSSRLGDASNSGERVRERERERNRRGEERQTTMRRREEKGREGGT